MKIRSLVLCSIPLLSAGLSPLLAAAPWNDNFSKAVTLANQNTTTPETIIANGNSAGATRETGESVHGNTGTNGASVWYRWTAPVGGNVTIHTYGSTYDTLLDVSTGGTVATQVSVAGAPNDDADPGVLQSSVTFVAVGGTTYFIAVDGYNGATGNFMLTITMDTGAPINDNFAQRIALFGSQISTINDLPPRGFTLAGGSREAGELSHTGGLTDNARTYSRAGSEQLTNQQIRLDQSAETAWFSWTAPYDGVVYISVDATFVGGTSVYTGLHQLSLVRVARGMFNLRYSFNATRGVTYQIAVERTDENSALIADGYTTSNPPAGQYKLSLSMENNAPYVVLNNPRHRQVLARQAITVSAYVVDEEDAISPTNGEPIFNDPSILPFVDRVKFYARKKTGPAVSLIGTDTVAPYEVNWIPTEAGDYELWAVAEDDEYGYDPSTDSVIVVGRQTSQNYPLTEVEIVADSATGQPLNVLTNDELFVQEMYSSLLGRSPTTAELADAVTRLGNATLTRVGLVQNLINQLASGSSNDEVIRVYRGMLRRLPTYTELTTATTALQASTINLQQLADQIAAGTEFAGLYGSLSNLQYVQAMFNNLAYGYAGAENFATLITDGSYTRALVALQLIEPAYFGKPALYDLGDYEEKAAAFILVNRRTPTTAELAAISSVSDLAASLIGSTSYIERYLPGAPSYVIGANQVYVSGIDNLVATLSPAGVITLSSTDTYALWQGRYGVAGASTADSEGDGINNLTEYAFESLGFDPAVNDSALLPTGGVVGSNLVINYPLDVSKEDLVLTPEFSTDMTNWFAPGASGAPSSFAVSVTGGALTTQLRQASVSTAEAPAGFLRVRIQRYDPVTGSVGK